MVIYWKKKSFLNIVYFFKINIRFYYSELFRSETGSWKLVVSLGLLLAPLSIAMSRFGTMIYKFKYMCIFILSLTNRNIHEKYLFEYFYIRFTIIFYKYYYLINYFICVFFVFFFRF